MCSPYERFTSSLLRLVMGLASGTMLLSGQLLNTCRPAKQVNTGREMSLTLPIPGDLANRLSADGDDLSRPALEGFGLEEYKLAVSQGRVKAAAGF